MSTVRSKYPLPGRVEVVCKFCNQSIYVVNSLRVVVRFCNQACYGKWKSLNENGDRARRVSTCIPKTCRNCNESFLVKPKRRSAMYCSDRCSRAHMRGQNSPRWSRVPRLCVACKTPFYPKLSDRKKTCGATLCVEEYRSIRFSREGNPRWEDGRSFSPYPADFNARLKRKIRRRDNHACQRCGKTESELGESQSIHHVDYDKRNCAEWNLLALCRPCNSVVNTSRETWTAYFYLQLQSRGIFATGRDSCSI